MRLYAIAIVGFAIPALATTAALAGTIKLQGTYTAGQMDMACIDNNGTTTAGTGEGGFGCKTDKGEISCTKEGQCTGTCEKCGTRTAGGGKQKLLGGILTNVPLGSAQPDVTVQQTPLAPLGGATQR